MALIKSKSVEGRGKRCERNSAGGSFSKPQVGAERQSSPGGYGEAVRFCGWSGETGETRLQRPTEAWKALRRLRDLAGSF